MRLWDRAWPYVEFSIRARRTDDEIGRQMAEVDGYRHANLRSITDRLGAEGRLRAGTDPGWAADLAFALTTPVAYEELVPLRGWPVDRAMSAVVDAVAAAVIEPGSRSSSDQPADWRSVARPPIPPQV